MMFFDRFHKYLRIISSILWQKLSRFITSDSLYLRVYYRLRTGEKLNLSNPVTFNEKMQWLKLHNTSSLCTQMADKYAVRQLIADTIGEQYLIPLLGVWDRFDDINYDELPDRFVLKTTHDSGSVVLCKDKNTLDLKAARKKLTKSLSNNYFWAGREYPYKNIPPRIIAEEYMINEGEFDLPDFKFFCFNGVPTVLFYASERFNEKGEKGHVKFDYYDMNLNHLPIKSRGHENSSKPLCPFPQFDEMKQLASQLSKGFPFLRVDFYLINGHVYFGELTFHHDGGVVPFVPEEWNYTLGDKIVLDIDKNQSGQRTK